MKGRKAETFSLEFSWFQPPSHYFFPLFVTDWGSSPPLAQQSLNGSCMFCWVPSSRTWAAWHCPPHQGPWPPGEPGPSGCLPSLCHPLWRTWRAPWPCWKTNAHALSKSFTRKMEKYEWWVGFTYFIHSSFRHSRQWDTTSTDKFSLDRATSSLFSNVGPAKQEKWFNIMYHHMIVDHMMSTMKVHIYVKIQNSLN